MPVVSALKMEASVIWGQGLVKLSFRNFLRLVSCLLPEPGKFYVCLFGFCCFFSFLFLILN